MGRYRRNRYRRKTKTVTKAQALSKRSSKSQASQILKLQRQVTSIKKKVVDNTKWTQYQLSLSGNVGGVTAPTYGVWNLIQPDQWEAIFQTRSTELVSSVTPSKFRGRSIGLEMMFQIGALAGSEVPGSFDPITATVFIASLRKETAKQFVDETTNGTDMKEDVHYVKTSMGTLQGSGLVMLNKGYFKVRYVKRFMLGGNVDFYENGAGDTPIRTTNLRDNNKRYYVKLPYTNLLKDAGPNTRSNTEPVGFKTLSIDEIEPHDQLYVFIFANSYGDQTVSAHANMVITGTTAN